MTRRPTASHALAMRAAAAASLDVEEVVDPAPAPSTPPAPAPPNPSTKRVGRPKGKRPVEARMTLYLDARRHAALARLAEDRGRSIHSLIVEGIDHVIGKPVVSGWK